MSQSMKDIFYHALLARAVYTNMKNNDTSWDGLTREDGQSKMSEEMADFIQSRFDFVASSLDNDGSIEFPSSIDPTDIFQVDGYDGIMFKEKATGNYVLANRGTEAQFDIKNLDKVISSLADLYTDIAGLGLEGKAENQIETMQAFLDQVKAQENLGEDAIITTTGHSLGGYLSAEASLDNAMNMSKKPFTINSERLFFYAKIVGCCKLHINLW
ncbi:hypothetical protein [uncultured Psychrobacter sp.]|uniref:hypothetical protein n=1 Tax=uncultured Psychrobacter sp. TaxID=259303 RepID=UPI00345780D9